MKPGDIRFQQHSRSTCKTPAHEGEIREVKMKIFRLKTSLLIVMLTAIVSIAFILSTSNKSTSALGAAEQVTWPELSFQAIATPLSRPVVITNAADGSGRLFVVEQAGQIRIIHGGQLLPVPFLDIQEQVKCCGEEGLLGLAFPPDYADKEHFYVYYTRLDGNNQVSRFYAGSDPNTADPNSEEELLFLPHPTYGNHNGGQLAFGPDGYLYIGTGDGGGGGDPQNNAQNLGSLMGKILRIDVDKTAPPPVNLENPVYLPLISGGAGASAGAYAIPPDNPFREDPAARPEIWAYGLRNPWRFSFDPETGDLYIADVGQNAVEEINFQPASSSGGENYGWNILEGDRCFSPSSGCVPPPNYQPPVVVYQHSLGCSVTGGGVYRGTDISSMQGIYLYGDYCSGRIWGLIDEGSGWQSQELEDTAYRISTFGSDENGEMYLADLNNGQIFRIIASP
jgi:glucose/arabinose dehydrogenase